MKILFYISKNYSLPIVMPLVDYAVSNKFDYAFYVSNKVKKSLTKFDNKILSSITETKIFNPDFVLVPGNFVDFRIPGIKVQIFHGLGIEKKSHFKIRHFFDMYCTSGPFVTKKFLELQKKYKYFKVVETGWPKIDYIINFPKNNLKQKYNIASDKKVILYAPTHSKKMQSAIRLLPLIPKIIQENEIWFIKLHELTNREIKKHLENIKSPDIRIIRDFDITPYLHLADILISDTSSVIYEFLALQKPVITYRTISREKKGFNITDKSKLRETINFLYKNPADYVINGQKFLNEVNPYLDGKTADRIFNALKNYRVGNVKKPLNLIRKLQIIYHSKFKKGYLR